MTHRSENRFKGTDLLGEAARLQKKAWWGRLLGAFAALVGALGQSGPSPVLGGMLLAGGLLLLAVTEEARRKAVELGKHARHAARRQLADEIGANDVLHYLSEGDRRPRSRAA